MEYCSCARGRQWCGIIHYYWWTASIKPRLLFSRAGYASCGLSLSSVYYSYNSICSRTRQFKVLWRESNKPCQSVPFGLPVEESAGGVNVDHLPVLQRPVALLGVLLGRVTEEPATDGLLHPGGGLPTRHDVQLVSTEISLLALFFQCYWVKNKHIKTMYCDLSARF